MDGDNWRASQAQVQIPGQVMGAEPLAAQGTEDGDWRAQLHPDSRQRIVNKIMETLKRHLPFSGPEGVQELKKIALRFEEKIFTAATSQSDYLRKISLKMLTMEAKSQNPITNPLQPGGGSNLQDPASQIIQSQMQNQVQQLPIPMVSNQSQVRQQILSQNIQNNIGSNGVPNPAGLGSALPAMNGMSQGTVPSAPGQNPNIQNTSSIASNATGNSMGHGVPPNIYANSQRQIQGRQLSSAGQEQPQQSQNSQQYLYNQQLQQHLMKQNFQQGGSSQQSSMQSQVQQQQQNLLQSNQLPSSQQAAMQSSMRQMPSSSSSLLNQQSSLQQSTQSMLQQQSQSALRQQPQQQPQASVMLQQQQQQNTMSQHPILPASQQQNQSSQQQNTSNIQPNQLIGQQNIIVDAQKQQQQRMIVQPNNMSNMQQQQPVSQQSNIPSMHQQQLAGNQHVNSSMKANQPPVHLLQQSKVPVQQQMHLSIPNVLPNQPQQAQSQPMQQQIMSQLQSQSGQLQQQLGLQQQANALSRDMQQRIQTSGTLLQQQTTIDPKQMFQSQRAITEAQLTSLDSSSQIGNSSGADWQEEVHQKIRYMNELYFHELNDMYQKMVMRMKLHDTLPQGQKNEQVGKFNFYKVMIERLLLFLKTDKNDVQPVHKDRMSSVEKHILNFLNSNRPRKLVSSLQKGNLMQPQMISVQQPLQQQPQISQMHTSDGQMNPQQNVQGSVFSTQQTSVSNMQHNSLSSVSSVSNSRQSVMDVLQAGSNFDPGHGNALNKMQQVSMNSLQQNPVSGPQQMNTTSMSSQTGLTALGPGVNSLQANSNMLQGQQIKQEPQMFANQQIKQQYQQRQMQQQYMHRQQMIQQQQQQLLMQSQQQPSQLPAQQLAQLNQIDDANDVKLRHSMGGKPGILQAHSSSQRSAYHHQQIKSGAPFSTSSQQVLHASSPQIGNHSSPQIDQSNILSSQTKSGTPLQSASSPFVVPSPSASMAPSPMPGDAEKITTVVSSLLNAGNTVNPPTLAASGPNQSLAIGTPGISASPLLAEFTSPDGTHGIPCNTASALSSGVEQPLDRLIKAVKSMSTKALSASISDISSIISLNDRIAGSAPGNGSRAAVGEDLAAMTKCRLQARNHITQDGAGGTRKMRRFTTGVTASVVSSSGSVNGSARYLSVNESDGELIGASCVKRPRSEGNHVLEEELREINERLIDIVVHISDDVDPSSVAAAAAASECGEGTVVKCSFSGIALGPNLKSQFGSAEMSPIQPLRLLIPKDYPNSSPVLLDKFLTEEAMSTKEYEEEEEELSVKAKSRLSVSLRSLAQPMSLGDIARTWEKCARGVISEYAQLRGGGTFSSKYGSWDNCLSAA